MLFGRFNLFSAMDAFPLTDAVLEFDDSSSVAIRPAGRALDGVGPRSELGALCQVVGRGGADWPVRGSPGRVLRTGRGVDSGATGTGWPRGCGLCRVRCRVPFRLAAQERAAACQAQGGRAQRGGDRSGDCYRRHRSGRTCRYPLATRSCSDRMFARAADHCRCPGAARRTIWPAGR